MSQYYLSHDAKNCVDCQACEVQCKTHKGLSIGPNPCSVQCIEPDIGIDPIGQGYVFMPCYHCEEAACMSVCPTTAIRRREKDGIVHIESSLCIGCKSCITACAWGACQWDPETLKAVKCDYCMDRLDEGLKPSCVTICLTSCLDLVPADEMPEQLSKHFDKEAGHPEVIK